MPFRLLRSRASEVSSPFCTDESFSTRLKRARDARPQEKGRGPTPARLGQGPGYVRPPSDGPAACPRRADGLDALSSLMRSSRSWRVGGRLPASPATARAGDLIVSLAVRTDLCGRRASGPRLRFARAAAPGGPDHRQLRQFSQHRPPPWTKASLRLRDVYRDERLCHTAALGSTCWSARTTTRTRATTTSRRSKKSKRSGTGPCASPAARHSPRGHPLCAAGCYSRSRPCQGTLRSTALTSPLARNLWRRSGDDRTTGQPRPRPPNQARPVRHTTGTMCPLGPSLRSHPYIQRRGGQPS
jgi:hypothetical protein